MKNRVWIINTIAFVLVFTLIFVKVSYLLRNIDGGKSLVEYTDEIADTTDVVFIGGSSTFSFWAPYFGWEEYGIASYDYSVASMSPSLTIGLMKEVSKISTPDLFVIDLRALALRDDKPGVYTDAYLRNITDSLRYSINRFNTVNYSFSFEQPEQLYKLENHIDIIKYHATWQTICENQFKYAMQDVGSSEFRGFGLLMESFESYEKNDWKDCDEEELFKDETMAILNDILDYCDECGAEVLFTLNPYYQSTNRDKVRYNGAKRIIEERGYTFINTNDYLEEIGVDFKYDFYDNNHVNINGSEKYTSFLGYYIINNYGNIVKDRRNNSKYSKAWNDGIAHWDESVIEAKQFIEEEIAREQGK